MNLRNVRRLTAALAAAIILSALPVAIGDFRVPFLILMTVLTVALMVVLVVFWRCPHCGKQLGRDVPKYCPHCGKRLDDLQ